MLKDRVIKPIIVASEKMVEYYYPKKDKVSGDSNVSNEDSSKKSQNTIQKLEVKFDELAIGSESGESSKKIRKSASALSVGKKRTFKELEKHTLPGENLQQNSEPAKKAIHLNQRMLQKASATVELMIGDSKFNMPNQAVTGNFMTIMLELTPDLITQLEK